MQSNLTNALIKAGVVSFTDEAKRPKAGYPLALVSSDGISFKVQLATSNTDQLVGVFAPGSFSSDNGSKINVVMNNAVVDAYIAGSQTDIAFGTELTASSNGGYVAAASGKIVNAILMQQHTQDASQADKIAKVAVCLPYTK